MCTCGNPENHVIARRKTADDIAVKLWSDGSVTAGLNFYVRRPARSVADRALAVQGGWLMVGEVELYDYAELRALVDTSIAAVKQRSQEPRRYLLAAMSGAKFQSIKRGRVIRHARSCECPRCERERLQSGGTAPLRGPRRVG